MVENCVGVLWGKMVVVAETQKGVTIHPDLRSHGSTGLIYVPSIVHPAQSLPSWPITLAQLIKRYMGSLTLSSILQSDTDPLT